MNKKERFCDVDNIVEWRHIITILLVLVIISGNSNSSHCFTQTKQYTLSD